MKVTDILNDTGKDIAPIGSVKVICNCNERKKLLQTVDTTNGRKSTDMQMLGSCISSSRAISSIHHRDKRARHEYNNVLLASLPIPSHGHQYTKPEALAVLLANDSQAAVKQMIKLKYVPCGKSSLYRMLQFHNQGKPILNTAWSTGKPRILKDTAISSIVKWLSNDVRRTYCQKEVIDLIIAQQNQMLNDSGHVPLHSDNQLKQTTLQNYTAELVMTSKLSLTQSFIAKTKTLL